MTLHVPTADVFTYANIPRVIWITDTKILGGYLGVDALLPLVDQHVKAGGFDSTTFGIGDFFGEGTLSWHTKQFDFAVGSGVWAPTGDSAPPPTTRIGKGFWTFMQTAGATWYIDEDKTWAVSALNRYEFSTEQRDTDLIPGQTYTLEWGVSKTLAKVVDLGAVGYYQQQVDPNEGASWSSRSRVAAVGPEVSVVFPKQMFFVSLRYNYEFMAEGYRPGAGQCRHLDPHKAILAGRGNHFPIAGRPARCRPFFYSEEGGRAVAISSHWARLRDGSFRKNPMPVLRAGVRYRGGHERGEPAVHDGL